MVENKRATSCQAFIKHYDRARTGTMEAGSSRAS